MGIVVRQSVSNTVITYIGFAIGAANALFMYPTFLGETYYGLTAFLLSSANILMPLMAFGVHNTLVKFYNEYRSECEKSRFLSFMLLLPLLVGLPVGLLSMMFYDQIASALSTRNAIVYDYVWQIPVIAICMGYFEIFYAWVKVHLKSVFGNFVKEVLIRILISIFLMAVYLGWMSALDFIYATVGVYFVATLAMVYVAFRVRRPQLTFSFPENKRAVLVYSMFIILSGSVANLLLDIDKFMLGQYIRIENIAYYSVAIFMATSISVPSRAMHQITYPITARLMSEGKRDELNDLYKKSSVTLQIAGGYVLLGILVNLKMVYQLLPPSYAQGTFVVFAIGISKYFDVMLGNNNAIIFNSKYYRMVLFLGLMLGVFAVWLNAVFIPLYQLDGAALATLIAIFLYSLAKLLFVVLRMKLFPFTVKTLQLLLVSVGVFALFYFWDFGYHPLLNIILKSTLLTAVYGALIYIMKISDDANAYLHKIYRTARKP